MSELPESVFGSVPPGDPDGSRVGSHGRVARCDRV
jgi:hypothetical protein